MNLIMLKVLSVITVLLSTKQCSSNDIFSTLCSKIFFKQPKNPDVLAYKEVINGVYIKTDMVIDKFPVYVNERGSIYFQYAENKKAFFFSQPLPGESFDLGLGADADNIKMANPNIWVKNANKKDVFGGVVKKWFQWNQNIIYLKEDLQVECWNFTDCQFRDLTFNYNLPGYNNPLDDYFSPLENTYTYNRQVYKHSKFNVTKWYLYFFDMHWNIGSNYTSNIVNWFVNDQALKPEFITSTWNKYNNVKLIFEQQFSVSFYCRGVNKLCSKDRCMNNGICSVNQINRTTCTCLFNYNGDDCSKQNAGCQNDEDINIEAGSLKSIFCLSDGEEFYDSLCKKSSSGEYVLTSNKKCTVLSTTKSTFTTKTIKIQKVIFNADKYNWIYILAITLAAVNPILGPLIFWSYKGFSKYFRILSLWLYFSMVILIFFKVVASYFNLYKFGPNLFSTIDTITSVSVPIFYLYILIEAQFCNEKKFVESTYDVDEIDTYLKMIYEKEPLVSINIECYHYDLNPRLIPYADTNGQLQARVEIDREKVISYSDSLIFNFRTWRDVSDQSQVPNTRARVTSIKLSKAFTICDERTSREFSTAKSNFIEANKNRDTYINTYTEVNIHGFKERVIGFKSNRPFWLNQYCFQLAHFLILSWPFRWLLNCNTQEVDHRIVKEISLLENRRPLPTVISQQTHYFNQVFQPDETGLSLYSSTPSAILYPVPSYFDVPPPPYSDH
ncbi:uncharacterized protein LOC136086671 [Hydra vulgaris]|uniref:Uncharacterized protein LOC136086671 n=1 Tax=Hydra vulgaris TaxID=6087 RepID=A0ABM4CSS7_HYDVU